MNCADMILSECCLGWIGGFSTMWVGLFYLTWLSERTAIVSVYIEYEYASFSVVVSSYWLLLLAMDCFF